MGADVIAGGVISGGVFREDGLESASLLETVALSFEAGCVLFLSTRPADFADPVVLLR